MTDERKTRVFLEPPTDPEKLPEQTKQHIAKLTAIFDFVVTAVAPNVDTDTGLLLNDVDWSKQIERFNESRRPEISLDEVIIGLESTRMPPNRVEQDKRIANELRSWLQDNQ